LLIKAADDKQPQLAELERLLGTPGLPASTKKDIEQEIWAIRRGSKTEAEAAYEIEFQFGQSKNSMTIHDLRLDVDGRVAQIDHLIVTRILEIWVCESKSFTEGVAINEHGEWSTYQGGRLRGIPSPVEQNKRHIQVLNDIFAKRLISLPKRLGMTMTPRLESLVLVSNRGRIARPKGFQARQIDGLDRVIKCEQLVATIDKTIERKDAGDVAVALLSLVGTDTIERLARELAALHKPITFNWSGRFGIRTPGIEHARDTPDPAGSSAPTSAAAGVTSRLTCQTCGAAISEKVARFCRDNAARFGGAVLCWDCQRKRRST
jgi:hypothetical protein